jgi:hypothetical protein
LVMDPMEPERSRMNAISVFIIVLLRFVYPCVFAVSIE